MCFEWLSLNNSAEVVGSRDSLG